MLERNDRELRLLQTSLAEQRQTVARIDQHLTRQQRHRRFKQVAGIGLVSLSMWMLWQPIAQGLNSGDMTMLAGLASALLGSALLVRA
jgi:hypothetical protein